MSEPNLELMGATLAGDQLAQSVLRIQARHGLSDGEAIAIVTVAFTRILTMKVGEAATVEYCRAHADELEKGLLAAMPELPLGRRLN